ncbi:c-type cytochrome domain-containing protein [Flavitalea flava]
MLLIIEFFGRFHPVLVHLPIGILLMGLLLKVLSRYPKFGISDAVIKLVFIAGLFSALVSSLTGYLLSLSGEYDESLVAWHKWMGLGVCLISVVALLDLTNNQQKNKDAGGLVNNAGFLGNGKDKSRKLISGALSVLLLILITVTGHLGGSLTHGSDYLTSALNGQAGPATVIHKPIPDIQQAIVYRDIISPVLEANCYSCHGPQKQKGKLRLDDSAWILRGGKDGPVIAGSGKRVDSSHKDSSLMGKSELLKRILLPAEDEHHMPPKEKSVLKESDIAILQWWIGNGSDFSVKVKELPRTARIASYLLARQDGNASGGRGTKAHSLVPEAPVVAAAEKDMDLLKAKKVQLIPVARGSNYLSANFINAGHITDKDLSLLLPLQKQLVWINLGDQAVGDSGMTAIGQCRNLTVLGLNHTRISDKGLVSLNSLVNLHVLNLTGTNVTANGVISLSPLKHLQSLFLFHTKVTGKDWPALKMHFPKVLLDSGGYSVPFAPLDTLNEMRAKK